MGYLSLNVREFVIPVSRGVLRVADYDYEDDEPNSLAVGVIVTDLQSLHIGVRPETAGLLQLRFRDRVAPAVFVHEIMVYGTKLWVGSGDLTSGMKFLVKPGCYQLSLWRNELDSTGGLVILGISAVGPTDA